MRLRTLCFSTYFPDLQGLWAFRLKKKPREVQTSLGFWSEKVRQMQTPHSTCVDAYSEEQTTEPHTAQPSFKGKASFWKLDADSRHKSIAPDERRRLVESKENCIAGWCKLFAQALRVNPTSSADPIRKQMTHANRKLLFICHMLWGREHIFGKWAETSFVLAKKDLSVGWFCLVCGQQRGDGWGPFRLALKGTLSFRVFCIRTKGAWVQAATGAIFTTQISFFCAGRRGYFEPFGFRGSSNRQ